MRKNLSIPEPPPIINDQSPIWSMVIKDMCDRHASGVAKYGTHLQAGNGRVALVDAYQEALDLCVYLRQEIEQRAKIVAQHKTQISVKSTLGAAEEWRELPANACGNLCRKPA